MNPLSYSKIYTYSECPLRYKYLYLDRIPTAPKPYFAFGNSLHATLAYFYNLPRSPTPEQLMTHYAQTWIRDGYKDQAQEMKYYSDGKAILEKFYELHQARCFEVLYCEFNFCLPINNVYVKGFIDRIDFIPPDGLKVVDYKTGFSFNPTDVNTSLQLMIYQIAIHQLLGLPVKWLELYHLNSNQSYCISAHNFGKLQLAREKIVKVAASLEAGQFNATPSISACKRCDFSNVCPSVIK